MMHPLLLFLTKQVFPALDYVLVRPRHALCAHSGLSFKPCQDATMCRKVITTHPARSPFHASSSSRMLQLGS